MARITKDAAGGANMTAFLDMLAVAEIGPAMLADPATDNGYRVLVGSTPNRLMLFSDWYDHPLANARPIEYAPGHFSTAAGRYQILSRYWPFYARKLGLVNFSPESQDRYAIQQIIEQRAADDIQAGRVANAITRCNNIWASLPGAGYGQREHRMDRLLTAFEGAGGIIK